MGKTIIEEVILKLLLQELNSQLKEHLGKLDIELTVDHLKSLSKYNLKNLKGYINELNKNELEKTLNNLKPVELGDWYWEMYGGKQGYVNELRKSGITDEAIEAMLGDILKGMGETGETASTEGTQGEEGATSTEETSESVDTPEQNDNHTTGDTLEQSDNHSTGDTLEQSDNHSTGGTQSTTSGCSTLTDYQGWLYQRKSELLGDINYFKGTILEYERNEANLAKDIQEYYLQYYKDKLRRAKEELQSTQGSMHTVQVYLLEK